MRRLLPAVALVVAIGTPAGAATIDPRPVRAEIARQVTATYPGLAFGNVACPDGVTRRTGTRFTCTVQLPGTFLRLTATQTDSRGTVTFDTEQAVLSRQSLEEFVAANASVAAAVTCGNAGWLVVRPGQQLSCRAALADGASHDVQLTVRDTAGNVTITGVA
jgi:Domain of unknown function (DUF4333)